VGVIWSSTHIDHPRNMESLDAVVSFLRAIAP